MIDRLEIRNFKSIAGTELEFGRVNLFIGVNGAGKSNLLEAIGVFSACLGRGIDTNILSSKGVRLSAPRIFKSSFKNRASPVRYIWTGLLPALTTPRRYGRNRAPPSLSLRRNLWWRMDTVSSHAVPEARASTLIWIAAMTERCALFRWSRNRTGACGIPMAHWWQLTH